MPAGYQNQYLEQGADFNSQITLADNFGTSYNLYNYSVSSQARRSFYSANATIIFNAEISDAPNGVITLTADAATTANVSPGATGKLVYDVTIKQLESNNVTRVLEGQIYISPSVTR
jgi:hypothetical protein